jgi:membrane-bound ClpP family serine protease
MLGLTVELWSPGAVLPGVVRSSVTAAGVLPSLSMLPVSYAGLLLIVLGMVL